MALALHLSLFRLADTRIALAPPGRARSTRYYYLAGFTALRPYYYLGYEVESSFYLLASATFMSCVYFLGRFLLSAFPSYLAKATKRDFTKGTGAAQFV